MQCKTMKVPLDPRTEQQSPLITNTMKKYCHGEFSIEIEESCSACAFSLTEFPEECEVCSGKIDYTRTVDVPWDMTKEIYKKMVTMANLES